MIGWVKKIPIFVLVLVGALLYLVSGFLAGYYLGYAAGQDDYYNLIESLK